MHNGCTSTPRLLQTESLSSLKNFRTSFSQLSKMVFCNLLMLDLRVIVKGFSIFLPNTISISFFSLFCITDSPILSPGFLFFKTVSMACALGFALSISRITFRWRNPAFHAGEFQSTLVIKMLSFLSLADIPNQPPGYPLNWYLYPTRHNQDISYNPLLLS